MYISFRVAKTAKDKDMVYRLRHQVFVVEEKRFKHPMDRIYDHFDSFEENVNLLAMHGDLPVGTIRVTMENPVGLPPLEHYDFRPLMRRLGGRFAGIGWLCVAEKFRQHRGLIAGLFKMMGREVRKRGGRHLIAPLHPGILPLLTFFGARQVDEVFHSEALNVPMVPIHVDLDRLPHGIRELSQDPLNIIFEDSDERRIYRYGEPIIGKGQPGDEAFLVMRGSVRVLSDDGLLNSESLKVYGKADQSSDPLLGPGQVFGELALLDDGPRTSTVISHSAEVDVMVWRREDFLRQLQEDKNKAFEICRILGSRFRQQIEGFGMNRPREALIASIIHDASREGRFPVDSNWLAGQCGLWPRDLAPILEVWVAEKMLERDGKKSIRVLDLALLKQKVR